MSLQHLELGTAHQVSSVRPVWGVLTSNPSQHLHLFDNLFVEHHNTSFW